MAKIVNFSNFIEYANFNDKFIESNPILYFHLKGTIKRVLEGKAQLWKFFNIVDEDIFLAVLLIKDECLIYSNGANDEVIVKLSQELEFDKFKRYHFFGTKQIIDALFLMHQVQFSEQKHRIIYECKDVKTDFVYSPGQLSMGDIDKLEELSALSVAFDKEYYEGFNDEKSIENAKQFILAGILEFKNIYQWNRGDKICAIAQAIYGEDDYVTIGHVFTNPEFRNKGYAASTIHRMTKGLLEAGHEKCMLVTNAYNPASNKAFIKVGYVPVGEYVVRYKEK